MTLTARGAIRPTTHAQAVERARSMVGYMPPRPAKAPAGWRPKAIQYRLAKYNGGRDPYAPHPADWSYGYRTPTADCVGFVAWACGFDRYQPGHNVKGYKGWLNTDTMIWSAEAGLGWFERIEVPELGCLAVIPSVFRDGKRVKVGHVGIVVDPLPLEWDGNWEDVRVIHCAGSNARRNPGAIGETDGRRWGREGGVFLRYLKAA